jgi:hypothetical protein
LPLFGTVFLHKSRFFHMRLCFRSFLLKGNVLAIFFRRFAVQTHTAL